MNNTLIAILAAGESRRMGRPKLCLPWGRTSILGHLIDRWQEAGAEDFLIVHGRGAENPVVQELDRLGIPARQRAETVAPERGMMGSVVTAARHGVAIVGLTHLIITLGDQPQLQTSTLRKMLAACATSPGRVVRPVYRGKTGHPYALPADRLAELCTTDAPTLRDFIGRQKVTAADLTCDDFGVLLDVDTPADYARAYRCAAAAVTQPLSV